MKKRIISWITLIAVISLLFANGIAFAAGDKIAEARSGVVRVLAFIDRTIYVILPDGSTETLESGVLRSSGTAFGVGSAGQETDVFVTNRHVVEEEYIEEQVTLEGGIEVTLVMEDVLRDVYILLGDYSYSDTVGLDTSRSVPCKVLHQGGEGEADLAVLRAAELVEGRMALPLLSPELPLEANTSVRALGFPASTDEATEEVTGRQEYAGSIEKVTVTDGIVSLHTNFVDKSHNADINVIQHTATINHGNSGGPLLTMEGAVAGVNTWGYGQDVDSGDQQAFAAIEIQYVMDILDGLRIDYDVYRGETNSLPVIIAAIVIAAAAVGAVIAVKNRKDGKAGDGGVSKTVPADGDVYRIQCLSGVFAGQRFAVNGAVHIGRDASRNDLTYPAETKGISGVHCVVYAEGGALYIKDVGSTYGTYIMPGRKLQPNVPVMLNEGDRFCLGSENEMFQAVRKGGR